MTRQSKRGEWDEDEMESVIKAYAEENGELTATAMDDPETKLPSHGTVLRHYGGVRSCIEELGLDTEPDTVHGLVFSRGDITDDIREHSEDGTAPKRSEFMDDSNYSKGPVERLFGCYTNAVFMAGKETVGPSHRGYKNRSEEILADYRQTTRENYWDGDPDDIWNTDFAGDTNYLNPTVDEFPFSQHTLEGINDGLKQPDVRIGQGQGIIDVETQDEIMEVVVDSENYLDIVYGIEDTDITEAQVKMVLNLESKKSFGMWMAEDEFPENTLEVVSRF